jgi:hypothetical protein
MTALLSYHKCRSLKNIFFSADCLINQIFVSFMLHRQLSTGIGNISTFIPIVCKIRHKNLTTCRSLGNLVYFGVHIMAPFSYAHVVCACGLYQIPGLRGGPARLDLIF